ncbi:MAG: carboxymuconolactone decarboxylase family protein [Maricaulaceae bacterium]
MPLVEPLPELNEDLADLAALFHTTLGLVPNSVLTMQRKPAIADAFIRLNRAVMETSPEGPTSEQKRLIAAVASYAAGCRYCQAHTAVAAKRFGGSDERVASIWDWERSDLYTPAEKAAFAFAQAAASVPNGVDAQIGAELKAHWSDEQIVEILGVVALFGFLNRWNDSMATTLEAPADDLAQSQLGAHGWERGKHV